jgi:hypothetical protein
VHTNQKNKDLYLELVLVPPSLKLQLKLQLKIGISGRLISRAPLVVLLDFQ